MARLILLSPNKFKTKNRLYGKLPLNRARDRCDWLRVISWQTAHVSPLVAKVDLAGKPALGVVVKINIYTEVYTEDPTLPSSCKRKFNLDFNYFIYKRVTH